MCNDHDTFIHRDMYPENWNQFIVLIKTQLFDKHKINELEIMKEYSLFVYDVNTGFSFSIRSETI